MFEVDSEPVFLDSIEVYGYPGVFDVNIYEAEGIAVAYNDECNGIRKVLKYAFMKNPEQLTAEERTQVLDYRLGVGNYSRDEEVMYEDIFMHGEFVKLVAQKVESGRYYA